MRKIITTVKEYEYDNDKQMYLEDECNVNEIILYKYDELSDKAKDEAKENMRKDKVNDYVYCDILTEDLNTLLKELFPNSDLEIQYSLNYCQGDGLNIYGKLNLNDMYNTLKDKLNIEEQKYIEFLLNEFDDTYKLDSNNHYCYCICDRQNVLEDIDYELEWNCYRDIKYDIIDKFNTLAKEHLCDLCSEWEEYGYKFLYEFTDDDLEHYTYYLETMFYEDGSMYN